MSHAPQPAEEEPLKDRSQAGSFDLLYAEEAPHVFAWAMRYARGRRAWAEDLTHEVFVRAWEHRAWLREDDVRGWLFRVTQNAAFSALRRESTVASRAWQAVMGTLGRESAPTPEALLEGRQAVGAATAAIDALPGQERVVMTLRALDELSQREIAQLLSLSEGYVSKLLSRARARLAAQGWKVDDERA